MADESGVVKWFNRIKGYGFIQPDHGGPDVFVHYSAIEEEGYRNLYEGDKVDYNEVDFGKGPQARDVRSKRGF